MNDKTPLSPEEESALERAEYEAFQKRLKDPNTVRVYMTGHCMAFKPNNPQVPIIFMRKATQ